MLESDREPTSDPRRRTTLAGRYQDEQLHHGIVDLATPALNHVDVPVSSRLIDVDLCLTVAELGELTFSSCDTESIADGVGEQWVGGASKELDTAQHPARHYGSSASSWVSRGSI